MKNTTNLSFGEVELTFFFGLSFLGEFLEEHNIELSDVDERLTKNPFKFLPKLMYGSYKHNCERHDQKVAYKYYDFVDLIDNNGGLGSEVVNDFIVAFTNSLTKNVPSVDDTEEKPKKK